MSALVTFEAFFTELDIDFVLQAAPAGRSESLPRHPSVDGLPVPHFNNNSNDVVLLT